MTNNLSQGRLQDSAYRLTVFLFFEHNQTSFEKVFYNSKEKHYEGNSFSYLRHLARE